MALQTTLQATFQMAFSLLLISSHAGARPPTGYSVTENGSMLRVRTPQGSTVLFSDKDLENANSYRAEIPLSELNKPVTQNNAPGENPNGQGPEPSRFNSIDELLVHANQLYNKGKFQDSLRFVEEILRRNSNHLRGLVMRGSLYYIFGFKEQAYESYKRALEIDPKNEEIKNVMRSMQ